MKTRNTTITAALAAALLAACGGGGDGPAEEAKVEGTAVPQSATTSAAGATAFVRSVASAPDNSGEPLVVGSATLATSETDEPEAVN